MRRKDSMQSIKAMPVLRLGLAGSDNRRHLLFDATQVDLDLGMAGQHVQRSWDCHGWTVITTVHVQRQHDITRAGSMRCPGLFVT